MEVRVVVAAFLLTGRAAATAEPSYDSMSGDGYHPMGGVEGKNWGVWETAGSPGCVWSIRSVTEGGPAQILDEGQAPKRTRVAINPDGDVGVWDGKIDGHRIVFVTHHCPPWRLT